MKPMKLFFQSLRKLKRHVFLVPSFGSGKRVFIMTFQWADNIGAQLQNYALSEKIKAIGFYPCTIKWGYDYYKTLGLRIDNLRFFSDSKIYKTHICYTEKELKKIIKSGNIIIFGGDQIFRNWEGSGSKQLQGEELPILRYYGDFVSGKKVMASYAASFGINKFVGDYYLTNECKKLLKRFDKLSVREQAGIDILNYTFDVQGVEVLDPVFLIPMQDYEKLISEASNLVKHDQGYIAYMRLGNRGTSYLRSNTLLEDKYIINAMYNERGTLNSIEQFLYNIKNSSFVITNSFHCMAFALIFHKPFVALSHDKSDTRIRNLLNNLNLQKCLKEKINDIQEINLKESINWDEVDKLLYMRKYESERYLYNVLSLKAQFKEPYVNWQLRGIRERYEKSYIYRKKAQEALEYKFGFRHRLLRVIIKLLVDKRKYNKLKRNHVIFFQDSKSSLIQFLGRFYN